MSVGWAPAANLLYQAGTKMRFDHHIQQFVPEVLPTGVFACGRVNGVFEFNQKLQDGFRAGLEAAAYLGFVGANGVYIEMERITQESPSHPWAIVEHPAGKTLSTSMKTSSLRTFRMPFKRDLTTLSC
jgi:sarcosine oxidase subunit alpha